MREKIDKYKLYKKSINRRRNFCLVRDAFGIRRPQKPEAKIGVILKL